MILLCAIIIDVLLCTSLEEALPVIRTLKALLPAIAVFGGLLVVVATPAQAMAASPSTSVVSAANAVLSSVVAAASTVAERSGGPSGEASAAERRGCQSDGYNTVGTWYLRYHGKARSDIGALHILKRSSPSNASYDRFCAMTLHKGKTYGEVRLTKVIIYSEDQGGGNRDKLFYDSGYYDGYAGGRAITPGEDRCALIKGSIRHGGKTFKVSVGQGKFDSCN